MERWIDLTDVELVTREGTDLVCRAGGRQITVPVYLVRPGTEVWADGDRGTLVVPLWFAAEAGLVPKRPDAQAAAPISRSSF